MACGQFLSGGISEMTKEDPQDLYGQGLARADNYDPKVADEDYAGLIDSYRKQVSPQYEVDAQYVPQYGAMLRGEYDANLAGELGALNSLGGIREQLIGANPESARLLQLLNQQAETDLMAGSQLTPEQLRYAQQSSRAAMAARGMNGSNAAVADEILRTYDLGQDRLNQRRAFAGNVVGMNTQVLQNPMLQYLAMSKSGANSRNGGATAMLRSQPGINLLGQVYSENQQNNRVTSANETQLAREFIETWRQVGGAMTGGSMGGGGMNSMSYPSGGGGGGGYTGGYYGEGGTGYGGGGWTNWSG